MNKIEKTSREEILRVLVELCYCEEYEVNPYLDNEYASSFKSKERDFAAEFHQFLHYLIGKAITPPGIAEDAENYPWLRRFLIAKAWLSAILKSDPKLAKLYSWGEADESSQQALNTLLKKLEENKSLNRYRKDAAYLLPASEWERKVRRKVPAKTRALLQKESQSRCPFCHNEEVAHHEVHHIDENPANNDVFNLILLCRNCHGKITAGAISRKQVIEIKNNIATASAGIELAAIQVDTSCAWEISEENPMAFFLDRESDKHPNLILNVTIINHQPRTVVLHEIELKGNYLFSGLSGPPAEPRILRPLARYTIHLPASGRKSKLQIKEQLEIPSGAAAQFQLEVAGFKEGERTHRITGRKALRFTLQFSSNLSVNLPPVFLNTIDENPGITIIYEN